MKNLIAVVLVLVCVLSFIGCNQQSTTDQNIQTNNATEFDENMELETVEPNTIPDFSYTEDRKIYAEGDPGVKTSGFEAEITFENVAQHAKNECTIEYDSIATYLDPNECVWKVHFYTNGTLGGDQNVYLDNTGKTLLIVYGE